MFLRPNKTGKIHTRMDLMCSKFLADPATDGTRQSNFAIFSQENCTYGGTGYTGEMKKEFSLNFILPVNKIPTYAL
jgi:phosphoenolpyruvate carboxykinase (ATP)